MIASTTEGVWNQPGASLHFFLRPHFYQTNAFYGFVLASIVGAVSLVYHRRVSALRTRHAQQHAFSRQLIESQERERQRIASELHDSLGQNLLIIKNRAVFGASEAPDGSPTRVQFDEINTSASGPSRSR